MQNLLQFFAMQNLQLTASIEPALYLLWGLIVMQHVGSSSIYRNVVCWAS